MKSADLKCTTTAATKDWTPPPSSSDSDFVAPCSMITLALSALVGLVALPTMPQCFHHPTSPFIVWITLWLVPGLLVISVGVLYIAALVVVGAGKLCFESFQVAKLYVSEWRRANVEGEGFELVVT